VQGDYDNNWEIVHRTTEEDEFKFKTISNGDVDSVVAKAQQIIKK
jgi:hypothetical protein